MKRQGFLRTIIFTILLSGLGAGIIAVGQRQEIRKEAAQDGKFTFAALGDTHAGITDPDLANYRERADANHRWAVEAIININPDFYLHLGDMVQYPIDVAWNDFFAIENPLMDKVPIYPTIGNHEDYNENHSYYQRFKNLSHLKNLLTENRPWYSFDWGNAHFISLRIDYDNYYPNGEASRPGTPQYQWLENDLKSTDKPWKIVFFHVQIYSSTAEQTSERKAMRKYLHPLFKKYKVDLVFGAHDHCYERVEADGITYIESGGGSNRREPLAPMPGTKSSSVKNHIVKVTIDGGVLSGTAISTRAKLFPLSKVDPGGEILDSFRLTKTIQPTTSLSFKIKFQGINEHRGDKKVKVTLGNGPVFENINVTSDGSGIYSGTVNNIVLGTYKILIKGPSHLQKNFGSLTFVADQTVNKDWLGTILITGDAVSNNKVDIFDYNKLVEDFGPRMPATGSSADFDSDTDVDIFDYNFLVGNFNQVGDF